MRGFADSSTDFGGGGGLSVSKVVSPDGGKTGGGAHSLPLIWRNVMISGKGVEGMAAHLGKRTDHLLASQRQQRVTLGGVQGGAIARCNDEGSRHNDRQAFRGFDTQHQESSARGGPSCNLQTATYAGHQQRNRRGSNVFRHVVAHQAKRQQRVDGKLALKLKGWGGWTGTTLALQRSA